MNYHFFYFKIGITKDSTVVMQLARLSLVFSWIAIFAHRTCSFTFPGLPQRLISGGSLDTSTNTRQVDVPNRREFRQFFAIKCMNDDRNRASLIYDERHLNHDDQSHPEKSTRASVMWHSLESSGLTAQCQRVIGREATKEELKLAHSEDHIDAVNQRDAMMDESTYFTDGTPLAARLAAGCVLEMTRQVS